MRVTGVSALVVCFVMLLPRPGLAQCTGDCASPGGGGADGTVGINDILAILGQWGQIGGPCDFGLGAPGIGIEEFLGALAAWGSCPAVGCSAGSDGNNCKSAIPVGEGTVSGFTGDNTGFVDDTSCALGDVVDEWYCYTSSCSGVATASLCNLFVSFDTTLAVFESCDGAEIACNDDLASCSLSILFSQVTWAVRPGGTYLLRVSGFTGAVGEFDLSISCGPGNPACTPGAGPCCSFNDFPGCDDPVCCSLICGMDPFCCDVAWDTICVDEATVDCESCSP